jgi:RNA polymerase sigma-70 factor, ECF subfamily
MQHASNPPAAPLRAQVTDADLVDRMTRGDRGALATLYARHVASLIAVTQCIVQQRHDAEDVVHDVFIEVWRSCAEYSEARGSVRTWLVMRARSRALDRLRASQRRRALGHNAERERKLQRHDCEPALHDTQYVRSALARVPPPQQGVIMLAYFEGLDTTEISLRLGIPTGTVKSRTHAALKTLRSVLGNPHD